MNSDTPIARDHERKDVDVRPVSLIVFGILLVCALVFIGIIILIHGLEKHEPAKIAGTSNIPLTRTEEFPAPRLEVKPGANLAELRAAEDVDLSSYGWIDRNAGTVRIPIDRAIELIAQRGLSEVGAGQTPLSLMQARPNESASPSRLRQNP